MAICPGSGRMVPQVRAWNVRSTTAKWNDEGWRTQCPHCARQCAVTPRGHLVQAHQVLKPKLTRDERYALLYQDTYDKARDGESLRPSPNWPMKEIEIWLMAYQDGVGDSDADGRKIGALKRWMNSNGMGRYTLDMRLPDALYFIYEA